MKALVRFSWRLCYAVWSWRYKRLILETRGWRQDVRAIFLASVTGESVPFVHDALYLEPNARLQGCEQSEHTLQGVVRHSGSSSGGAPC